MMYNPLDKNCLSKKKYMKMPEWPLELKFLAKKKIIPKITDKVSRVNQI